MDSGGSPIEQESTVRVEIRALNSADSPRTAGENTEHIEALAAAQTELPPIIVHRPTMRVIDGQHRLQAARLRGDEEIEVRFFGGDEADAFVLAVKSNIAHGLPLSLADRRQAAERIIASHPHWSDRMVASVTGLSPGTVGDLRKRRGSPPEAARVGQDGRIRPINGAQGRILASVLIAENPDLSLRQVARLVGISPETVRDVKNRLRRGEDPLPQRLHAKPAAIDRDRSPDPAATVKKLTADPALRLNESGRNLLMLLKIHTMGQGDWDTIINNVPPHCSGIIARLARDTADVWSEFATRVERQTMDAVPL